MRSWTEVYRPKSLEDLQQGYAPTIKSLTLKHTNISYLLSGPAGVGKTTTAKCLANEVFPDPTIRKKAVMIINASDERNIAPIFDKVLGFSSNYIGALRGLPQKRIIILDEIDNMTKKAQEVLCILMDETQSRVQFILTCNYISKVETRLQSRCLLLKCTHPTLAQQKVYLENICSKENLTLSSASYDAISEVAGDDLRRATNILQTASLISKTIDPRLIYSICETPSNKAIEGWIIFCGVGVFEGAYSNLKGLIEDGHLPSDILHSIKLYFSNAVSLKKLRVKDTVLCKWLLILQDLLVELGRFECTPLQLKRLTAAFCSKK